MYNNCFMNYCFFFFSSRRRHTRCSRDWSSDVCSSDLRERPDRNFGPHVIRQQNQSLRRSIRYLKREGFRQIYELSIPERSEERRVGKECRSRWWPYHEKKNKQQHVVKQRRARTTHRHY